MSQTHARCVTHAAYKNIRSIGCCACFAKCNVYMMTRGCASARICKDNAHKHDTHNLSYPPGSSQCACGTRARRYAHRCPSATLHPRPMKPISQQLRTRINIINICVELYHLFAPCFARCAQALGHRFSSSGETRGAVASVIVASGCLPVMHRPPPPQRAWRTVKH